MPEIQCARENFESKYLMFVDYYRKHDDVRKVLQMIAVDPYCKLAIKPDAKNCIYSYIKTVLKQDR